MFPWFAKYVWIRRSDLSRYGEGKQRGTARKSTITSMSTLFFPPETIDGDALHDDAFEDHPVSPQEVINTPPDATPTTSPKIFDTPLSCLPVDRPATKRGPTLRIREPRESSSTSEAKVKSLQREKNF